MQRPRSPTDVRHSPSGRHPDRDHTRERDDAFKFSPVTRPLPPSPHPPHPKRARHRSDSPPEPSSAPLGSASVSSSVVPPLSDVPQQTQLPSIRHLNPELDLPPVTRPHRHTHSLAGSLTITQPASQSQTRGRHMQTAQPPMTQSQSSPHSGLGTAPTRPLSPQYAAATPGPGSGAEFLPSGVSYAPPRSQIFAGDHALVSSPLSAPIRTPVFHQPPPHPHSAHPLSQTQPPYQLGYPEVRPQMQPHPPQYQSYQSVPPTSAHPEARLSPGDSDPEQEQDREDGDPDSQDMQSLGHTQSIVGLGIGQEPPKKKRRRQALSCTECKRRKIKCDRLHPCGPCTRRNEPTKCQWHVIEPVDKYVTRAEWDDLYTRYRSLEERYSRIENILAQLHPDLSPQAQMQTQQQHQHIHQEVSPRSNTTLLGPTRRPSANTTTLQTPVSASGRPGTSLPKDSISTRSGSAPPPHLPPAYTPTSAIPSAAPYTSIPSSSSAHPSSIPPYQSHSFIYPEHDRDRDRDLRELDRDRERVRDRDRRTCAPSGASSTPASAERVSASSQVQPTGQLRSNSSAMAMTNPLSNDSGSPSNFAQPTSHLTPRINYPHSPSYRRYPQTQGSAYLSPLSSLPVDGTQDRDGEEFYYGSHERGRERERDNTIGPKNGPAQTSEAGDVLRARWSAQHQYQQSTHLPRFSRKEFSVSKGSMPSPLRSSTPAPINSEFMVKSSPGQDRSDRSSSSESATSRQSSVRTPIPDDTEIDTRIVASPHGSLQDSEIRGGIKRVGGQSDDETTSRSKTPPNKRPRRASLFLSIPSAGSTPGTPPPSQAVL